MLQEGKMVDQLKMVSNSMLLIYTNIFSVGWPKGENYGMEGRAYEVGVYMVSRVVRVHKVESGGREAIF